MAIYASKLEQNNSEILNFDHNTPSQYSENDATPVLPMSWALKSTGKKKRFTEAQKQYLIDVLKNGEVTGQKADPGAVSKSMRKAKNLNGCCMFKKEFLSSQQISNCFSCLAKAKNLDSYETTSEVKLVDHPGVSDVHALVDEVMNAIALQHTI
jgi:hypothetical protein